MHNGTQVPLENGMLHCVCSADHDSYDAMDFWLVVNQSNSNRLQFSGAIMVMEWDQPSL